MFCVRTVLLFTFTQAISVLSVDEGVPCLDELVIAMQSELNQKFANDNNEQRCAAVLRYSMRRTSDVAPAQKSELNDILFECARTVIDITQSRFDAKAFLSNSPDCIHAGAVTLIEKSRFEDAWLLSTSTVLEPRHRAQILAQLSQAAALNSQKDIARDAVFVLRRLLETDFENAADCDDRTYLQAMVSSASLGDELNCRWFCARLSVDAESNDLLPDFYANELSGVVATEAAFPVLVQVVKDLPSSRLREYLCVFLLFHDQDNSLDNDVERLLWLQPQPTVQCASICRKAFLGQLLTLNDTDFLTADRNRLRITVNWLTRYPWAERKRSASHESVRQLCVIAETTLASRSAPLWFIKSRLGSISIEVDPEFCGDCLKDWIDSIEQGAEAEMVAASAPHILQVAIALSEVDLCRRILATWNEKRHGMETLERRLCDAEIMRTLKTLPKKISIEELPADICDLYPFAVGMTRPRDFEKARGTFKSPRDRFWFVAGFLAESLKVEGLIIPSVVEFCTATQTSAAN